MTVGLAPETLPPVKTIRLQIIPDDVRLDSADELVRYDAAPLGGVVETPQGFLRVPATLTRGGIFEYRRADGSTQREYRPPDQVLDAGLLAQLAGAPVTEDHPAAGVVTAANFKALGIGHAESARRDGDTAVGTLLITDPAAIEKVRTGALAETSLGYRIRLAHTPGEVGGQRYDAVQHVLGYNHVALGPKGWARGGPECKIRLDGTSAAMVVASAVPAPSPAPTRSNIMDEILQRIDGLEFKVTKNAGQAIDKALADRDGKITAITKDRDGVQARLDAATAELATAKAALVAARDPKAIEATIAARVALETDARKVLGADARFDGKTPRDVKAAAIAKAKPTIKLDGRSDDYVDAMFDAVLAQHEAAAGSGERTDGIGGARAAAEKAKNGDEKRADATDPDAGLTAKQRHEKRMGEAGTKPITVGTARA